MAKRDTELFPGVKPLPHMLPVHFFKAAMLVPFAALLLGLLFALARWSRGLPTAWQVVGIFVTIALIFGSPFAIYQVVRRFESWWRSRAFNKIIREHPPAGNV